MSYVLVLVAHIQPRKHALDHADYTAPTPGRQLKPQIIQIRKLSALEDLDHEVGADDLSRDV